MFEGVGRDLAYAGRSLAKARAFTIICVVSLGIGMTPVIAIPSAARITRLPPPGVNTNGFVELVPTTRGPREAPEAWSYPDFVDLRAADTGITLAGWIGAQTRITRQVAGGAETQSVGAMFVSANYFETVGATLARGPGFDATADDPLTAKAVVILGYDFWQNHFNSDPDIVGKSLDIDGTPHIIVGVAPDRFEGHLFLHGKTLFIPLGRHPLLQNNTPQSARYDRGKEWIYIVGRLGPGTGIGQASAAVDTVTSRLAKQYPASNEFKAGVVEPYDPAGNVGRSQFRALEAVALTLTGTVLLVVCLNLSGMLQVRSAMRERELSIRRAIGASRRRLVQVILAEAIILAALGATLGSIVIFNLPPVLSWLVGKPLPEQVQEALKLDSSIFAFCIALCLVTTVVFGCLPALRFSRPVIISALKDDAGIGGVRAGRVHRLTAALQVAIAVPLMVLSGISLDRVRSTATQALGFEADDLYAAPLKIDAVKDRTADLRIRSARENLAKVNGVVSASVADGLPLDFASRSARVPLPTQPDEAAKFVSVQVTRVGDGYLNTMGIPLLAGRGFAADDRAGAELVTVISKRLAERLFPDAPAAEAIGKRVTLGDDEKTRQILTIVGVTGDFPTSQMSTEREQLLLPLAQHPASGLFLLARSAPGQPPAKMTTALEAAARDLNPASGRALTTGDGVEYASIVTGVWLRHNSVRDFLVQSAVGGGAGGVILMLAALGIYGVVGLMVATRTREIAVRIALGASRARVLRLIVFDVVKLVMPGVVFGLVITAALIRVNGEERFGIPLSSVEPLAYVVGAAVALLVAVLASLVPARRAASVQPMVAMRSV